MNSKIKISIVCIAVVIVAAAAVVFSSGGENKETSQTVDVLEPVAEPTEPVLPDITDFSDEPGLTGLAKSMRPINNELVGWIRISNTQVDYPVYQHKEDDPAENYYYYLDKDIFGDYLERGTIFLDYRDNYGADVTKQTDNMVLYGHNMLNGSMFGDLHNYRTIEGFYEENPIIEFSSNYEDYKYIIFAYLLTSGDLGDSYYGKEFTYWDIHDLSKESDFNYYVQTVDERSYIHPDIDVQYGDKLVTLSTCYLDEDESRLIVVGRRLRDGETVDNITKKTAKSVNNTSDESEDSESDEEEE